MPVQIRSGVPGFCAFKHEHNSMKLFYAIVFSFLCVLGFPQAHEYAKNRIVVKYKTGTSELQKSQTLGKVKGQPLKSLGRYGWTIKVPPGQEKTVVQKLQKDPNIEVADLDYVIPHEKAPDDTSYAGSQKWYYDKMGAENAWDVFDGSTGTQITIAILDSGVDTDHPDLVSLLVPGWNFISGNSNVEDDNGHGTQACGSAVSVINNTRGIAGGFLWSNVKLMPVKVSGSNGNAYSSTLFNGLIWAADNGARVANMSFMVSTSSLVKSGITYFVSKGGVVTVSAGNYSTDTTAQGLTDNPNCLTVGALSGDVKAGYSNYGAIVDVMAQGTVYTTIRGGGYGSASGTSFSAPLTAGLCAFLMSNNANLSPYQIMDFVKSTCTDLGTIGYDNIYSYGRINAYTAIVAVSDGSTIDDQNPTVNIIEPADNSMITGTVSLSANATDNVQVASVAFYAGETLLGTDTTYPYSISWDTSAYLGTVTITAVATDTSNNTASDEATYTVIESDTVNPTIVVLKPRQLTEVSGVYDVTCSVSDNVGIQKVQLYIDKKLYATSFTSPYTFSLIANNFRKGQHWLQLHAYDSSGNIGRSALITFIAN